ncbi:hypothetical protein D3C78_1595370 [compost metagenome]
MPESLQHLDLFGNFSCVQAAARKFRVGMLISAVDTIINTIVADIQRCKQDDPVAVYLFLNAPGDPVQLLQRFLILHMEQHGRFPGA